MMDETLKYADRVALEKSAQMQESEKPRAKPKEGKSLFDEMLEQNRNLARSTLHATHENKQAGKEAAQGTEKSRERFREQHREKENKEERKKESSEERTETRDTGKKVVGREGNKNREQAFSGQGFRDGGGSQSHEKKSQIKGQKNISNGKNVSAGEGGEKIFQKMLVAQVQRFPKTLPQEILSQIVRYVRIGINAKGRKELELDLHQEVFKGLRLRFHADHGKVTVHFLTADAGVKKFFEREKPAIEEALKVKGVVVKEVRII